jgi:hypothetical protein
MDPKYSHYLKLLNINTFDSDAGLMLQDIERLVRTCNNQHRKYVKNMIKNKKCEPNSTLTPHFQKILQTLGITKNAIIDPYSKFSSPFSPYLEASKSKIQFKDNGQWVPVEGKSQPMREEHNAWGGLKPNTIEFILSIEDFSDEAKAFIENEESYKLCIGGFWFQRYDGLCSKGLIKATVIAQENGHELSVMEKGINVYQHMASEGTFGFSISETGQKVLRGIDEGSKYFFVNET